MPELEYVMEFVGGPFDGLGGFAWIDDGTHPPALTLYVGWCPGARQCAMLRCAGKRHAAYWEEREEGRPSAAVAYGLESAWMERTDRGFGGRAIYAIGSLDHDRWTEAAAGLGERVEGPACPVPA